MSYFNKLLVVIDPTDTEQKSLARALEFSQRHPCQITLFLSVYDLFYDMTTMLSSDDKEAMKQAVLMDRTEWLKDLLAEQYQEYDFYIKVVWHSKAHESIISAVEEGGYDLVVKSTHQHDLLKSVIFTPTDWHLIRKCPASLLFVKDHKWVEGGNILAAVHTEDEATSEPSLSQQVIENSELMATILESKTHLVNAYPPVPLNIMVEIPDFDPTKYNQQMKKHHKVALQSLAQKYDIAESQTHVLEGLPETIIPDLAKELDAELVVMGTVGRTGLSAALIGNTAEQVIDNINCDLLALKPI